MCFVTRLCTCLCFWIFGFVPVTSAHVSRYLLCQFFIYIYLFLFLLQPVILFITVVWTGDHCTAQIPYFRSRNVQTQSFTEHQPQVSCKKLPTTHSRSHQIIPTNAILSWYLGHLSYLATTLFSTCRSTSTHHWDNNTLHAHHIKKCDLQLNTRQAIRRYLKLHVTKNRNLLINAQYKEPGWHPSAQFSPC